MKTKGRRTIEESFDVDVDAREFLRTIYERSIPKGLSYLSSDGYWYREYAFDYHKREELYEKAREATPEEIEFLKAYRMMHEFVKKNNL